MAPERFGSYLVGDELGIGGMASVHIAEHVPTGRRVALKRLLPHKATEPEAVRSFLDEARLVVQLKHPNIAETYDSGEVDGTYFIAMEYVSGHTLGQLIRQCIKTIGVIPFPITVNILIQLCDALEYAHTLTDEQGKPLNIIHRDISPANVILSSKGIVKLIDFGIAKATTTTVESHAGVVKGKFRYMAPEYLKGKLDSRCDLWALGAVAHELLTNKHLFDGSDDFNIMYNVRYQDIVPPSVTNPDVPPNFDVIVMTALQRDPAQRWQSAGAMRTALVDASHELQTIVTNAQLIEWVDWTFTQAPPQPNSEVSQLIALFKQPTRARSRTSSVVLSIETETTPAPPPALADAPPADTPPALPTSTSTSAPETRASSTPTPTPAPAPAAKRNTSPPAGRARTPARPINAASTEPPARRKRSRLRPWLLFFLLISLAFAIWRLGYAPREIDEWLARHGIRREVS